MLLASMLHLTDLAKTVFDGLCEYYPSMLIEETQKPLIQAVVAHELRLNSLNGNDENDYLMLRDGFETVLKKALTKLDDTARDQLNGFAPVTDATLRAFNTQLFALAEPGETADSAPTP